MKKTLLSILSALTLSIVFAEGNDDNDRIVLLGDCHYTESVRYDIPVFHAEINANSTVLVQADRPTDFEITK